jgi:hypothetical protein
MNNRSKWLVFGVVAAMVVLLGLLVLVIAFPALTWGGAHHRGPGMGPGGLGEECPWCRGTGYATPGGFLTWAAILLLVLCVPLGAIAVLVAGVVWLTRTKREPEQGGPAGESRSDGGGKNG